MNSITKACKSDPAGIVPKNWFSCPLKINRRVPLASVDPRTWANIYAGTYMIKLGKNKDKIREINLIYIAIILILINNRIVN